MKRFAVLVFVAASCLSISASAQTGWVRMADGPWSKPIGVFFLSNDTGFVHERNDGAIFYFTFDAGKTWLRDTTLRAIRTNCIRKDDLVQTPVPRDHFMTHESLVLGGIMSYSGCSTYGSDGAIWKYDIGTRSWKYTNLYNPIDSLFILNDKVLFAGLSRTNYYEPGKGACLYRSSDAGVTWQVLSGVSGGYFGSVTPHFQSVDTGYVKTMSMTDSGPDVYFHWTSNAGKTWRTVHHPILDTSGLSWEAFYGNNGLWYDNSKFGLLSSRDLGVTWQPAVIPPIIKRVKPDDAFYDFDEGYRITRLDSSWSFIEHTLDSGGMWLTQQAVEGYLNEISAPTERVAYAVGPSGLLYKTTDGGGRFADVASAQPRETRLKARSSGSTIMVENASDDVRVFDLLGRVVRTGSGERFADMRPGIYVVASGGESARVIVNSQYR